MKLLRGDSCVIIKRKWGESFSKKLKNDSTPTINDRKVTISNSSFELRIEEKYTTELIPVKVHNKGLVFLVAKTLKNRTNHSLKPAKVFLK